MRILYGKKIDIVRDKRGTIWNKKDFRNSKKGAVG